MAEKQYMTINMGPQHPATHGVLRLVLELDGEVIVKATPHIGHLHRGVEKLAEHRTYHQVIPLTDRLDYTNAMGNNLAYVLAVEKLLGLEVPKRAQYLRVMMAELQRIAAHLIWLGTHVLDIGALTPIFYTFREREDVLRIFEEVAGGRLTPTYLRIGGVSKDLPEETKEKVKAFVGIFSETHAGIRDAAHPECDLVETDQRDRHPFRRRTRSTGASRAPPCGRPAVKWDVRKAFPYSSYDAFDFDIPIGSVGDVYDRYTRPYEGDGVVELHREAGPGAIAQGADPCRGSENRAASQGGGSNRHGRPDPPFQDRFGGVLPAPGGGLCQRRIGQGRTGILYRERWLEPSLPRQDPAPFFPEPGSSSENG